ncbi:hypothetical protein BO83DRAFT_425238 [Aspergillus eucalypticola CBS 122712]|uniref:Uncharacterized protein n=1 Tax=Aspergillus eucalypticola (strain CBS 122712 / IBT 29274) TaxID=1448314 RepID=A0A317VXU4_ASPEC|nr:uncharacterized protein BO83DRAFT_425238 [Aspergillus eucalypticola CBS 122712]PWY77777.1 hypothetical protein BO83DRAFT_425238 [Aspergillus eucalypticola CBS 122712]
MNLRLRNILRGSDKPWTKGNYYTDILASLERSDNPTSDDYVLYSRFLCTADEDFLIWVDKYEDYYRERIEYALESLGKPTTEDYVLNSRFACDLWGDTVWFRDECPKKCMKGPQGEGDDICIED